MKILFINSVCGIRSTGRIVTDLAEQYMTNGYLCKIAYGREQAPELYQGISYKLSGDRNVKINALKTRIFDNEAFNAKDATKKFIHWANNYDPDVLWLHNLHGYYINIELLFNWIKSRPQMQVKWTLHDCWAFTGHCSHFAIAKCEQWKSECKNCPQKGRYPASLLIDNSRDNYRRKKRAFLGVRNMTLITPSNWLASLVKQSFLAGYPIEVEHNKIDPSSFKPTLGNFRARYELEDQKIVLGVASTWDEQKGLSDFIKLSELLDRSYTIVLVGLNKKQSRQLPENILGIERTDSVEELAEIYTAADVFVNPTYEDNYPTVNLEAESCGTPVITYDTGGCRETVHLPTSLVIPTGDLTALANALETRTKGNDHDEDPLFGTTLL